MKVDLDEIERKAHAIANWDEERDAPEQECVFCKSTTHTPADLDPSPLCNRCAQAYAGETAPVVLSLIARIREMEAAARELGEMARMGYREDVYGSRERFAARRRELADIVAKGVP